MIGLWLRGWFLLIVLVLPMVGCEGGRLAERQGASVDTPIAGETEVNDVGMATTDDDDVAEEWAAAGTPSDTPYAPPTDGAVVVTRDIYYGKEDVATLDAEQAVLNSLDIYAPKGAATAPVMVMIHGGGWQIGDKANPGLLANKVPFFTTNGWLFVSINYRLSPAVQHPAHVQDVATALAWVEAHSADYGGDPTRLYVMGHSAGAHLAALVAMDEQYLEAEGTGLEALSGVILLDGAGYNVATPAQFARGRAQEMYRTAFGDDPAGWDSASPITHVEADKGIPPFFVAYVVRREPSRVQSERLVEILTEAGVPAELFAAEGKTHATINQGFGVAGDAVTGAVWAWLQGLK